MIAEIHWPWQDVNAESLVLSWQALTAIAGVSGTLVSVSVLYLRLFVDNRISGVEAKLVGLRADIREVIQEDADKLFLAKSTGQVLEYRLADLERRLASLEKPPVP